MHIFPNGKRYIGITCQKPVEKRWYSTGSGYHTCPKMWNAIQKYGWQNVEHVILYEHLPQAMAEAAEMRLIKEYDSIANGYNVDKGGNVCGSHSEETRAKISRANKGKIVSEVTREKLRNREPLTGSKNPFYGRHHSEQTKRQHSEFMKGNQYNKGHHHSEEFKRMKSEQMKAKYQNGGNPRCRKVIASSCNSDGVIEFHSLREAAQKLGCSLATIYNKIVNHQEYKGYFWRYANGH